MPIYYRPTRGYLTPPVVVIGDEVATGIKYKLPEAVAITRTGINSGYGEYLIDRDVAVWPYIRNRPWIVIALGTNDGYGDYYPSMVSFRNKINPQVGSYAGTNNPHVVWVAPLNNSWAENNIRRVASEFNDLVLDVPNYTETTRTVAVQQPVYYPWPWSRVFNSPPNVWRYQTVYKTVSQPAWLSSDGNRPNEAGYNFIVNGLRKMTNNWNVRYN